MQQSIIVLNNNEINNVAGGVNTTLLWVGGIAGLLVGLYSMARHVSNPEYFLRSEAEEAELTKKQFLTILAMCSIAGSVLTTSIVTGINALLSRDP